MKQYGRKPSLPPETARLIQGWADLGRNAKELAQRLNVPHRTVLAYVNRTHKRDVA